MKCYLCGQDEDTRPYGPNNENVCFDCAMQPENKETTERKFVELLEQAGPVAVIGTQVGPFSAE